MKPIWAKITFWRNVAFYHPAIRGAAVSTALRSGGVFARHGAAAAPAPDAVFDQSAETTAHPFWADAFGRGRLDVKEMLEIGAFEGRTTSYAARLFEQARITCIDPWTEYGEMSGLAQAEARFNRNVAGFGPRIRTMKGFSSVLLPQLLAAEERFDVIFIDGSHAYGDVVLDSEFAWRLLKPGGVLIWDDYLWRKSDYGRKTPKLAIDHFLSAYADELAPLWAFKQVAVRKL